MSTVTQTPATASKTSLASSATFRTFALVFAMATPVIYVIVDMMNWPLFTYHPGTNRVDLGFARAVPNEGPAMYWYGWSVTTLSGAEHRYNRENPRNEEIVVCRPSMRVRVLESLKALGVSR